jgi:hypothetical protein
MEPLECFSSKLIRKLAQSAREGLPSLARRANGLLAFVCVIIALPGCILTESYVNFDSNKPTGDVAKVMAIWQPAVASTPDPVHGGDPLPGIAGRVYLFGPDLSLPLVGDGTIVVDLYSDMAGAGKEPLEEWRFDKASLKLLLKRDAAGWGYTMFLPWSTYRPDISHVHLRLRYERPNTLPIYANCESMALQRPGDGIVRTTSSQRVVVPTSGKLQ